VSPSCPSGIGTSNATLYVAASGAKVFDAGTFYWAWGLDDGVAVPGGVQPHYPKSHDFIVFTENIRHYLLLPPAK
jgi:hypothetical protein